ncbi:glycosyltransferase family 2 protein [Alistipes shahii]|uniref:glycosyltransferase family 2 protein n=1 Tax=Alistipes shahii TaxID=328814 RepID=UPI0011069784|nr:glycosyltransferase [Alistipes shahii]
MTNQDLISIIVPVYNMARWLDRCIQSLTNQTYTTLEIILVDDGSTDNSLQLCKQYAKQDPRIIVINKENGGQGSARNSALDIAHGQYIGFVDPDDWIALDMYAYMLNLLQQEHADIVQIGWIETNTGIISPTDISKEQKCYKNREALSLLIQSSNKLNTSVCNKLFNAQILKNLRFTEVRAYEDDEFVYKAVWRASKIITDNTPKYFYFIRGNSTMTAKFNLNKLALLTIQKNICDFIQENIPEWFNKQERILCSKQFYILSCLLTNKNIDPDKKYYNTIRTDILNSYNAYLHNPLMEKNCIILYLLKHFAPLANVILSLKFHHKL